MIECRDAVRILLKLDLHDSNNWSSVYLLDYPPLMCDTVHDGFRCVKSGSQSVVL